MYPCAHSVGWQKGGPKITKGLHPYYTSITTTAYKNGDKTIEARGFYTKQCPTARGEFKSNHNVAWWLKLPSFR